MRPEKLFFALFLLFGLNLSQAMERHIEYYNSDNTSPMVSPTCLMEDNRGILWIGTMHGPYMFDASRTIKYESGFETSPWIASFIQDADGFIWSATSEGIVRFNYDTDYHKYYDLGVSEGRIHDLLPYHIDISEENDIFGLCIGYGLYRFDGTEFIPVDIDTEVLKFCCCGKNRVLTLDGSGIVRVHKYSNEAERGLENGIVFLEGKQVDYMGSIADEALLSTYSGELYLYNGNKDYVEAMPKTPDKGGALSFSFIGNSKIVISTSNYHSYIYDRERKTYEEIQELCGKYVTELWYNRSGILWAAIRSSGFACIWESESQFTSFQTTDLLGGHDSPVSSLLEWNGKLYISTEGDGVLILDQETGKTVTVSTSTGLSSNMVWTIAPGLCKDDVLVGHSVDGLDVITGCGRIQSIRSSGRYGIGITYCLKYDPYEGCYWAATFNGLVRIDIGKEHGIYYVKNINRYGMPWCSDGNGAAFTSVSVSRRHLYAGSIRNGLLVMDKATGLCSHIGKATQQEPGISENVVLSLQSVGDSALFVGTAHGLDLLEWKGDGFTSCSWTMKDGLRDDSVHGILVQDRGPVWISTNNGISRIDIESGEIVNFSGRKDLQGKEFSNGAFMRGSDGRFYFGGRDGFNCFRPEDIYVTRAESRIFLTRFEVKGKDIRDFRSRSELRLSYNDYHFRISFSALDYKSENNREYVYCLDGFDKIPVYCGTATEALYTNLKPGRYIFRVWYLGMSNKLSDNPATLKIVIQRPWWNSIIARLAYILLITGIACVIYRWIKDRAEKKKVKDSYESKLNFFTDIAHEFVSPLTLISGAADRMSSYNLPPKVEEYKQIIDGNAERMRRLIRELMDFQKVDAGFFKAQYSQCDPGEMTRRIIGHYSDAMDSKGIRMETSIPEKMSFVTDPEALEKIIYNLISNANRYTSEGGAVTVVLTKEDGRLHLMVKNTGEGVSKDKLEAIFDRFRVLDNFQTSAGKNKHLRNGIGMALVKSLAENLGGTVRAESEVGQWTLFEAIIPEGHAEEAESRKERSISPADYILDINPVKIPEISQAPSIRPGAPIIFIVDDEPQIRYLVNDILQSEYSIIPADDGSEAVRLLRDYRPDLIITDINMPVMNGIELFKFLRDNEITRYIPIVFLTIKTDLESQIGAYELGGDAFIPKPFRPSHLKAVVKQILTRRTELKEYFNSAISNEDFYNGQVVENSDKTFMVKLTNVIEDNISMEHMSLDFIAGSLGVSKSELYNRIKRLTSLSPVEFIRNIKLRKAAHLLRTTSQTVQEVMYKSGFNNRSYFYKHFTTKYSKSPREYRMQGK